MMKCGQCGYAEASTPLQLRQHVRKRHEPKLESSSCGVMLQVESGDFVPASAVRVRGGEGTKRGKSRGGQVRRMNNPYSLQWCNVLHGFVSMCNFGEERKKCKAIAQIFGGKVVGIQRLPSSGL